MGGLFMLQKIKKLTSVLIIVVLLPYIVTTFMNGKTIETGTGTVLDEYCIGVLASEVSPEYEDEMLKAQAVIVRTTVYNEMKELDAQILKKPKLDIEWYQKLKKIWEDTKGQVLMYDGKLALVPFHQVSNGQTRKGQEVLGSEEYPYLQIKDCSKDIGADTQMQTKVIDVSGVQIVSKDSAGYVMEVKMGEEICSGDSFRDAYGLASSSFELQEFDGKTRVITRGVGHGLGMSQYMANEMAKEGKSYQEILEYFFGGTEMKEVAEIIGDFDQLKS